MTALINTLLDNVKNEFLLPEPEWKYSTMKKNEFQYLFDECSNDSEFDPLNKRKEILNKFIRNEAIILNLECDYGKLFCIFEEQSQIGEFPFGLWARIFRMYSGKNKKPFKVYFLAVKNPREFPPGTEPILPQNINGGYTYRCKPEKIIIYRAEDATRVLLHELQHSCCLDKVENGVDLIEAETEAWAELIYVALLSQGKKFIFNDLLKRQSEWIIKQNIKVKKHMDNPDSMEFPWRYTLGKEMVWRRWEILKEDFLKPEIQVGNSLRLTYPPNELLKDRFKVSRNSVIL
jgi:hypothetical protein